MGDLFLFAPLRLQVLTTIKRRRRSLISAQGSSASENPGT